MERPSTLTLFSRQALSFGPAPSNVIVAMTNEKHFSQFVTAAGRQEIIP
jgi:hypothetical protein